MTIWPTVRYDMSIDCSFSELAKLLHDYLETNSEEVVEHDSQVIAGEISDDTFRFWRKYSAGFGQPILTGEITTCDKQFDLKIVFRVSTLSTAYFLIASALALSMSSGILLAGTYTTPEFVMSAIFGYSAFATYFMIRSGFLYEQDILMQEFLEYLSSKYRVVIKQ